MAILPRRAWCSRMVTDTHGSQSATDDCPVRPVAISKQITRCLIPGECLGDLARDPFRSRVRGDVAPHQASPGQPHDHDAVEKFEANGRRDEHVHGGDVWRVVAEESLPGLRPPSPTPRHVLGDGRLRELKAPWTRGAPQSGFSTLIRRINTRRSASIFGRPPPEPRLPTPVAAKAGPMPMHERLGTNDHEHLQDRWKPSIQLDVKPAIVVRKRNPARTLRRRAFN